MKFGAKYEILKALTRGDVETFTVRDRTTGEQLLAYIFRCAEPPQDQSTVQWILSSFARMAPDAPGTAVDLGTYDVSNFAYVIMSLPPTDALDTWIRQYQGRADRVRASGPSDPGLHAAKPEHSSASRESPVADALQRPSWTSSKLPPAGHDSSSLSTGQHGEMPLDGFGAQPRQPGEFTRQFFREVEVPAEGGHSDTDVIRKTGDDLTDNSERQSVSSASSPKYSSGAIGTSPDLGDSRANSDLPSGFSTKLFVQDPSTGGSSQNREYGEAESAKLSTGEFTKFFQVASVKEEGGSCGANEMAAGPGAESGGFTSLFGAAVPKAGDDSTVEQPIFDHSSSSIHGSSTEISDQRGTVQDGIPSGSYPFQAAVTPQSMDEGGATQVFGEENRTERTPAGEQQESPDFSFSEPAPTPSQLEPSAVGGATVLFRPPPEVAAEVEATSSQGPSEYTAFISREALSASISESEGAVAPPGSSKSGGAGAAAAAAVSPFITPPAVPSYQVPSPQVPAYPLAPAIPGGATPAMPSVAAPAIAAPSMPTPAAQPSPAPKSYWPLIITLNVLFILAVLLILYFALKH